MIEYKRYRGGWLVQLEQIIDRKSTHSVKWYLENKEIIPLCIADMDFQVSEEIRTAT